MNIQKKIFFCKQCGNVIYDYQYDKHICCNQEMCISEIDPSQYFNKSVSTKDWKDLVRTDLVKQGELTNKTLKRYYKNQEKLLIKRQNDEWKEKVFEIENRNKKTVTNVNHTLNPAPPAPVVTCPYCHSTNTKKISAGHRWLSTGLFGLASSDLGKQWKCVDCGSKF